MSSRTVDRATLKRYAEVIAMWVSRFDTFEIAKRLEIPEAVAARWVANYRDQMHAMPAPAMVPLARAA